MALRPKATSWWALSALVADRSGESPRLSGAWPRIRLRRAVIGAATWIKLAGGLGRANDDGSAVLCLTPPAWAGRARCAVVAMAAAAVVDAALIALGVRWWPAAAVILLVTLVAMATAVRVAWCCRKGDGRMRAGRPAGGWHLCDFARSREAPKGMGSLLLDRVCAEADARNRVLYLETSAPELVTYYKRSGFEEEMSEDLAWGTTRIKVTLMVRRPRCYPSAA